MELNWGVIIFSGLLLGIDFYSEIQIKNYGSILERLVHLLKLKSLFNIVKLIVLLSFILNFVTIAGIEHINLALNNPILYLWKNSMMAVVFFSVFQIFYNTVSITKQFGNNFLRDKFLKLNYFVANLQYLIYRIISFTIVFICFILIHKFLQNMMYELAIQNLGVWDWLEISSEITDNYNKGVYFSLILTLVFFFIFNNVFLKKQNTYFEYRTIRLSFFKYFFISIILSIGLFFGFFSIFNGIYNLNNVGLSEWISKENVLGILPIRFSSVLILSYLLAYIYVHVLHKKLYDFLKLGILPIRHVGRTIDYTKVIDLNNKETLFFCQISFFVVNLALAEMFIIYGHQSIYLSVLNFAILVIIDDFKIIDDYNRRFSKMLRIHFLRLSFFNLIMIISAIIVLLNYGFYKYLLLYLIIIIVLGYYYLTNLKHYQILGRL